MDVTRLLPDELIACLRAYAAGDLAATAAVELLIQHDSWIYVPAFLRHAVQLSGDKAWIEWANAISALDSGALPCSAGEEAMLRIAASIAADIPVPLGRHLASLDERNREIVAAAIRYAAGAPVRWPA